MERQLKQRTRRVVFGGAASASLSLLLLVLILPLDSQTRGLIVLLLAGGWALAGCRWVVLRFGRRGALALVILALVVSGSVGYAYWLDEPNRHLVYQIEQINGCIVATGGGIFTGTVDHVIISSKATDEDVRRFTELDGLDGLRRLLIIEARISDATAKRLSRFSRLKYLTLYKTGVTEEAVEQLRIDLPECDIKDQ